MATRVVSPILVGRAEQLAALDAALAEAGRGKPLAVLVGGEAGVGKTRLVSEFAARSRGTSVRVLTGGCLDLGADGVPFAPFTSVLRELVRELGTDGVAALLAGGTTKELARLLPEFGEPAEADNAGEARARLFEQMLNILEQLADRQPVVLVIEDAHWADRSSRDLLTFLIRNQHGLDGLLIIVTYRTDELHRTHPLRSLLAELNRISWVSDIELGRLTRWETGKLIARITGSEPPDDVLDAAYRRTEGNPLFVEALAGDGKLSSVLPESLRDLLVASVRRLPEDTQQMVRVASAGGDRVGHGLLATVTGLDGAALVGALRPAVAANVLLTDSDRYLFRHALIREAVHDELLPGERGQLHSRFAQAIGADPALVPHGRAAVEQAHHWYAAHDTASALISAWQAAAEAGRTLAYSEQLAMLSRVPELWEQVPGASQRIGADHAAVLEAAVQAAELAGEFDRGIMFATAAVRELAAAEPVRAALLFAARGQLKYQLGWADHAEDLREAVRLVPADPPSRARARVLEALAHDYHHRTSGWDADESRAIGKEAVTVARQAGDAATEAAALTSLACALPLGGNLEQIRGLLAEARAIATRAKAYGLLLRIAITESDALEGMGQHEMAAVVAREGIATAREYGFARTSGTVLAVNLAEPLVSVGRWDEAAEVIEHALQVFPPRLKRSSLARLASEIALARGDLATAAELVASISAALLAIRYKDETHLPLARLETELRLAQGRPGEAMSTVGDALDSFNLLPSPRYGWPLLVAGARACVGASSAREKTLTMKALALRDRLRAEAGKLDVEGLVQSAYQLTFAAEAMRADGAAATEAGTADGPQPGDLCIAWDQAAEAWETAGQPYPLAIALLRSAGAALSAGDHDGGAARLRRAASLAQRLGAAPLSDDIARLAQRARIGLGPDQDEAATGTRAGAVAERDQLGLTARELEVLRLVAAGRSNREVAGELFISAKTASVHVSNILSKLGVGSRGEAAAIAYRLGLFESLPAGG